MNPAVARFLKQFAPFLSVVVAAVLVVLADPADRGGDQLVAGAGPTSTTTTTEPSEDAQEPDPFAPGSEGVLDGTGNTVPTPSLPTPALPTIPAPTTSTSVVTTTTAPDTTTTTIDPGDSFLLFDPLPDSAACSAGGDEQNPLRLAAGWNQATLVAEPAYPAGPGQNTWNLTGPDPERYLYRTHSDAAGSSITRTDLFPEVPDEATTVVAERDDWERLDGAVWTRWRTLLVAEGVAFSERPDPDLPEARSGLVYEVDPASGTATPLPALGSRPHRGMAFDSTGNLYGVSVSSTGHLFRFVPSQPGSLTSGNLYALAILSGRPEEDGEAQWRLLDADDAAIDADSAAQDVGATVFNQPSGVAVYTSLLDDGSTRNTVFVTVRGEDRVLALALRAGNDVFASTYVAPGINAPDGFRAPHDLAVDPLANLYIAERTAGSASLGKTLGDDIWVATPSFTTGARGERTERLASLTDCNGLIGGLLLENLFGSRLVVNVTHTEGAIGDFTVRVTRP